MKAKEPRRTSIFDNKAFLTAVSVIWAAESVRSVIGHMRRSARNAAQGVDGSWIDYAWFLQQLLYAVLPIWGLYWLAAHRRSTYPPPGLGHRELFTSLFYGRVLSWKETMYKMPVSFKPSTAYAFTAIAFMGGPFLLISLLTRALARENADLVLPTVLTLGVLTGMVGMAMPYWFLWKEYGSEPVDQAFPEAAAMQAQ